MIGVCVMACAKDDYRSRYESIMNTWSKDFDCVFFFGGDQSDKDKRLIKLEGVGENYYSAWKKQMYGLEWMYYHLPKVDWFWVCGDDTFFYRENMETALENFDKNEKLFISGHCGGKAGGEFKRKRMKKEIWYKEHVKGYWDKKVKDWGFPSVNRDFVREARKRNQTEEIWWKGRYASGGGGFCLSRALLKDMVENTTDIPDHLSNSGNVINAMTDYWSSLRKDRTVRMDNHPANDIGISIMIYQWYGLYAEQISGIHPFPPEYYLPNGEMYHLRKLKDPPISFHYIKPDQMYQLYKDKINGIVPTHKEN